MATYWTKEPEHKHLGWQSVHRPEKSWQKKKLWQRIKRECYGRLHMLMTLGWYQPPQLPRTAFDQQKHLDVNRPLMLLLDTSLLWEDQCGAVHSEFIVSHPSSHPSSSLHPTLLHLRGAESKKDTSLWDVQGASPSWIQLKNPLPLPCNQLYLPVSSVMLLASWEKPADVIHMGETFSKGAGLTSRPNSWWKVSKAVNLEKADAPGGWGELTLACKDWWWASLNVTWVT